MDRLKITHLLRLFKKHYPDAKCALQHKNSLELLIATMLSAQSTDAMVNKVTAKLFGKYKTAQDYVDAPPLQLQQDIRSTGFYKNKAKNIQSTCKMIMEKFAGKVPETMEELLLLPGVARKTSNVVLFNAFGIQTGIAVDTHVMRLAHRLELSKHQQPEKIERDLMAMTPKKDWGMLTHYLISHGRKICKAQKPLCGECFLNKICPSAFKFDAKRKWIGPK